MKKFNSKRFTLVALSFIILSLIGIIGVFKGMEGTAASRVSVLGALVGWYTKNETDRPSK